MIFDTILLLGLSILLLLPGVAGIVIPGLPGIPYMFLVALGYAAIRNFQFLSTQELMILGGIALASIIVDYLAGTLGARFAGASMRSMGIGLLGLVIGLILLPPVGGILGLFMGIFYGEFIRNRNQHQALRAATGGVIGSLVGIGINLILALGFIISFVLFALSRIS